MDFLKKQILSTLYYYDFAKREWRTCWHVSQLYKLAKNVKIVVGNSLTPLSTVTSITTKVMNPKYQPTPLPSSLLLLKIKCITTYKSNRAIFTVTNPESQSLLSKNQSVFMIKIFTDAQVRGTKLTPLTVTLSKLLNLLSQILLSTWILQIQSYAVSLTYE